MDIDKEKKITLQIIKRKGKGNVKCQMSIQ